MARLPRLTVPGYPHHVIQRGNNRQPIFVDAQDFRKLRDLLEEASKKFKVAIHSYVLMSNHLHLLATPETGDGIGQTMQAVGRSYVRYFNDRHGRTGTLWEGRYKSTLIQAERYLLACMVYIDLNPVRAGMVADPSGYAWSGFRHYAGIQTDKLVTPHPMYWELGNTPFARESAYVQLVRTGISGQQQQALTDATLRGWALGDRAYLEQLQRHTTRRLSKADAGRPKSRQAS